MSDHETPHHYDREPLFFGTPPPPAGPLEPVSVPRITAQEADPPPLTPAYVDPASSDRASGETPSGEADDTGEKPRIDRPPVTTGPSDEFDGFPASGVYGRVKHLGLPVSEVVAVGSSVIEALVGPDRRLASDTDLVVSQGAYHHFRQQPGMEEVVDRDGYTHVVGDGYDITTSWNGQDVAQIQESGYEHNGVYFADLAPLYGYKQDRGLRKDRQDLEIIRERLHERPVPLAMLGRDLAFIHEITPERMHGAEDVSLLWVAANGLYTVNVLFGHEGRGVRSYSGEFETGEVPATYHAWLHSALGTERGQQNFSALEAQAHPLTRHPEYEEDRRAALGFTYHDIILGHGRKLVNPGRHDEQRAADILVRHLETVGIHNSRFLEKNRVGVGATAWNEKKRSQAIEPSHGHILVQRTYGANDMSAAREPYGPRSAVDLVPEDLSRQGMPYGEPLPKLLAWLNRERPPGTPPIRITTTDQAMHMVDAHPHFPVFKRGAEPNDPPRRMTLREATGDHIEGSGHFYHKLTFPSIWLVGSAEMQQRSGDLLIYLGRGIQRGEIKAAEAASIVKEYERSGGRILPH